MKILDNLSIVAAITTGVICLFIIPITLLFSNFLKLENLIDNSLKPVITILGAILAFVGLERYKTRENIEKKLDYVLGSSLEAFTEVEDIIHEMEYAITKAKNSIRATSFMVNQKGELYKDYYGKLADKLKTSTPNFRYYCCYNNGVGLKTRKEVFTAKKLGENYKKMIYFSYQDYPSLNILIIDESIAFIGYPVTGDDEQIAFSLKITSKNENSNTQKIINSLRLWYDNVLKKNGKEEDTKKLLEL